MIFQASSLIYQSFLKMRDGDLLETYTSAVSALIHTHTLVHVTLPLFPRSGMVGFTRTLLEHLLICGLR